LPWVALFPVTAQTHLSRIWPLVRGRRLRPRGLQRLLARRRRCRPTVLKQSPPESCATVAEAGGGFRAITGVRITEKLRIEPAINTTMKRNPTLNNIASLVLSLPFPPRSLFFSSSSSRPFFSSFPAPLCSLRRSENEGRVELAKAVSAVIRETSSKRLPNSTVPMSSLPCLPPRISF
jgi:hypothetical protein